MKHDGTSIVWPEKVWSSAVYLPLVMQRYPGRRPKEMSAARWR
jgi:hypothetical protein